MFFLCVFVWFVCVILALNNIANNTMQGNYPTPKFSFETMIYETFTIEVTQNRVIALRVNDTLAAMYGCDYGMQQDAHEHTCGIVDKFTIENILYRYKVYISVSDDTLANH